MEYNSKKKYIFIGVASGLCALFALGINLGVAIGPWYFIPFTTYILMVEDASLLLAVLLLLHLFLLYIKLGGEK